MADGRNVVPIISKRRLKEFWSSRKSDATIAKRDLTSWHAIVRGAKWANFGALKQTFGSADKVGDCVVFDVGNNRFRLIGRVRFSAGKIYVLKVMDHAEYDKGTWIEECGCHQPPPAKTAKRQARPPKPKPPARSEKKGK